MEEAHVSQDTTSLEEILEEANALLDGRLSIQEPEAPAPEEAPRPALGHNDKVLIGLMATACALCLGIIGILVYWLDFLG